MRPKDFLAVNKDPKFYYLPNLKAGWMSFREMIYDNFDEEDIIREPADIIDLIKRTHGLEEATGFTVVRNPYSRIVSFYYDKLKKTSKWHLENGGYRSSHLSVADAFNWNIHEKTEEVLEKFIELEFDEFIYRYKENIRSDPHTRPQSALLSDYQRNLKVDHVFKLENINEDIGKIENIIGKSVKLYHYNETKSKRPHYKEYYDIHTKELVGELYKSDLKLFDYTFE